MLIFLHVPKSAGTSIRIFLWEALGRERVFWHGEDGFLEEVRFCVGFGRTIVVFEPYWRAHAH